MSSTTAVLLPRWSARWNGSGRAAVVGVGGAEPDQGDPLAVVQHVHVVVLAAAGWAGPAVVLERLVEVVGDLDRPALAADELLHPLAGGVVEVVGVDGRLGAGGLGGEGRQLVGVVPVEVPGGGLGDRRLPLASKV